MNTKFDTWKNINEDKIETKYHLDKLFKIKQILAKRPRTKSKDSNYINSN